MKTYISGKITGLSTTTARRKFNTAETLLQLKGYNPINPMKMHSTHNKTWEQYMVTDISELLHCDAIYMLKNWGTSKGARIEYAIAKELGLKIMYEGEFNNE